MAWTPPTSGWMDGWTDGWMDGWWEHWRAEHDGVQFAVLVTVEEEGKGFGLNVVHTRAATSFDN